MLELENMVFASTFRDPATRWYSQYRFEHLERRDQSPTSKPRRPFADWYGGWVTKQGLNYYTTTFLGRPLDTSDATHMRDFYWTYIQQSQERLCWAEFAFVLHRLQEFDLLLVKKWLKDSASEVEATLGWKHPARVVLPHAIRGVKASAREQASPADEQVMRDIREQNWIDVLLFYWVKRVVAERIACKEFDT